MFFTSELLAGKTGKNHWFGHVLDLFGENGHAIDTLPETNSSPLKIDGWKTIVSFWDGPFSGAMLVLGRVCFVENTRCQQM